MKKRADQFTRPICIASAIMLGPCCLAAPAAADTRTGVDVSTSVKVASNASLQPNATTSAAASLQINPWIQFIGPQSRVQLRSNLNMDAFTADQGTNSLASLNLDAQRQLSPFAGISGGANYYRSRGGLQRLLLSQDSNADGLPLPTTPLPDVTFGGSRTKRETFDTNLILNTRVSAVGQLDVNLGASRTQLSAIGARNYDTYNAGIYYVHTVSGNTSGTANITVSRPDYRHTRVNDGLIISPHIGINQKFSERLTLTASLGAAFARSRRANGSIETSTSLSGSVQLCRFSPLSSLCLSGGRSTAPTASGSLSTVTDATLAFSTRLSELNSLSLNARYSKNEVSTQLLGGSSQFYGASATLTRRLNRRMTAFVSPSFAKTKDGIPRKANFQLEAGLRFGFGASR